MRKRDSGVLLLTLPVILLSACSDGGLEVVTPLPNQGDHTPHTGIEQGVWPPQPLGMTNIEPMPASAREGALSNVVDAARGVVLNNPNVKSAVGDDYIEFDGSLGDKKSNTTASFVFYSYSNDETVVVSLSRGGEVDVETYAAAQYQPTEHATEVDRAIAMGQSDLTSAGFETAGLIGTAMLAFPPVSQLTDADQQYYPERVMYVTFGPGDGDTPVYSALVNLSSETVSDSGLIQ